MHGLVVPISMDLIVLYTDTIDEPEKEQRHFQPRTAMRKEDYGMKDSCRILTVLTPSSIR
jgi:hypothetical protein